LLAVLVGTALLTSAVVPATAAEEFVPGSVQSRGRSLRFGGFIGGTEYSLNLGGAFARAQGTQGNAQAQAIDLGLFGLILSQPTGCGGDPPLPRDQQPAPLRASSVGGNHSSTNRVADAQLFKGGTETVSATTKPSAEARTKIAQVDLNPVIAFDGIDAVADAVIDAPKQLRDSTASVNVGAITLAEGLVRIEGLRWLAARRSGASSSTVGRFTVGKIEIAGVPLPTETPADIAQSFAALNGVIGPLGLRIEPPAFVTQEDGTNEVTPMVVVIGGNDQGNVLIGPLLDALQPLRDQVIAFLNNSGGCPFSPEQLNSLFVVVDAMLAAITGSGGLRVEVGGARTLHDTRVFESTLGDIPPVVGLPGIPGVPSSVVGGAPTVPGGEGLTEPGEAGRVSTRCVTTHPTGSPGCSKGSAVLAGFIGLLAALALLGAEIYRSRHSVTT
jgi:hypothetical protein